MSVQIRELTVEEWRNFDASDLLVRSYQYMKMVMSRGGEGCSGESCYTPNWSDYLFVNKDAK